VKVWNCLNSKIPSSLRLLAPQAPSTFTVSHCERPHLFGTCKNLRVRGAWGRGPSTQYVRGDCPWGPSMFVASMFVEADHASSRQLGLPICHMSK
jgi:hypothetical protein